MLYTALHQPADMAALKSSAGGSIPPSASGQVVRGRNGYENFGAIRTKPGRADSPPCISMSCSDKIAGWTVLGTQGALLAELFEPTYIGHIVVGGLVAPVDARMEEGFGWKKRMKAEVERALSDRLLPIKGEYALQMPPVDVYVDRLPSWYRLHRPQIHFTSLDFPYSKPVISQTSSLEPVPSVLCVSHTPTLSCAPDILHNGCRQGGVWKSPGNVSLPEKFRSKVCKLEVMRAYVALRTALHASDPERWQYVVLYSVHW